MMTLQNVLCRKQEINQLKAYILMRSSAGKVFTVTFVKKDGSTRVMNCRTEVKKGLTGKGMKYNALEKLLMPVYDMQKREFRMINLDTVTALKINGQEYIVS